MGLEGLAQDHRIDRGQAEVAEEPGLGADRARVVAAVEAGEDRRQVGEDLGMRGCRRRGMRQHQLILSPRVQAQTYSPRRAVTARTAWPPKSGQPAASSVPSTTAITPLT